MNYRMGCCRVVRVPEEGNPDTGGCDTYQRQVASASASCVLCAACCG